MNQPNSDYELYLYLSFIPRFAEASLEWFYPEPRVRVGTGVEDESWWIAEGVKTFKKAMVDEVASTPSGAIQVVYLSGGLDSRMILGGLLEILSSSQIVTATYGIPGSWDMEISAAIAKKFGLRHEVFDLTNDRWDVDQLVDAGKHLKRPISVHQSYVRQKITSHFGDDCFYWSGLMGDALLGAKMPKVPSPDKRTAIEELFLKSLATKHYKDDGFRERVINKMLAECPWEDLARFNLTLDQQLLLGVWVPQLTYPTLVFNGFNFMTPFMNKQWLSFGLSVPYQMLIHQHLYKRILQAGFSTLAKFPVTGTAGMSVTASRYEIDLGRAIARIQPYILRRDKYLSHPRTNYINWPEALRDQCPFQEMILATIDCLKQRHIFDPKEIDRWWSDHQTRKEDYTFILLNLSSLELLLRAGIIEKE